MSNDFVKIDKSGIDKLFKDLNVNNQKEIVQKGLLKGGKLLRENTRQRMLQKMPKAASAKGKANKPMAESIRIINDKDFQQVIVSLMSNYLNIFFEKGTDRRYLKKNHPKDSTHKKTYKKGEYRGKITALNFFKEAREQSENDVIKAIEDEIINQLNKLIKQ